eukprot:1836247-Alexandrium_andersonii.AAC.1
MAAKRGVPKMQVGGKAWKFATVLPPSAKARVDSIRAQAAQATTTPLASASRSKFSLTRSAAGFAMVCQNSEFASISASTPSLPRGLQMW